MRDVMKKKKEENAPDRREQIRGFILKEYCGVK